MGICYRVILVDEFDWKYENYSKEKCVEDIKKLIPHATKVADIRNILIFDIDKTNPSIVVGNIKCDEAYFIGDNEYRIFQLGDYYGCYSKE